MLRSEVERRFGRVEKRKNEVLVGDHYEVDVVLSLGTQECPWSSKSIEEARLRDRSVNLCGSGSFDRRIRNLANDVELSGPELIAHLIAEHGFFEGFGSPPTLRPVGAELEQLCERTRIDAVRLATLRGALSE